MIGPRPLVGNLVVSQRRHPPGEGRRRPTARRVFVPSEIGAREANRGFRRDVERPRVPEKWWIKANFNFAISPYLITS